MLMENTVKLKDPKNLLYVFDLKGSTVDRKTSGATKPSSTLKDQNFLLCCERSLKQGRTFMNFSSIDRRKLISTVRKDVNFLRDQGLMDYSLLVCIEKKGKGGFSLNYEE